jgi:drug/metabolite transporter (DMT)-like permease
VALVLLAGAMWSIAGLVVRLIEHAFEWQILFYRSIALVVTLVGYVALRNGGSVLRAFRAAGLTAVMAGLILGTAFASWIFAMTHTSIANALFVLAASPFVAAALARVLLGERVRPVTLLCMGVSAAGIAVMVAEGVVGGTLAGNLFALVAAVGFGAFTVTLRAGRARDMTPAVCWAGIWGAALGAAMIALDGRGFSVSGQDLALCALLGVVQVGLGLILFTIGSRHVPAGELTLLSLTEVVLGPLWVWLGVGEVPGPYTFLGGIVVLAAVVGQALPRLGRGASSRELAR